MSQEFDGSESAWEAGWGGYFEPPRYWYDENYICLQFDHYMGRSISYLVGKQLTQEDIMKFNLDPVLEGKIVDTIGYPGGNIGPPLGYKEYAKEHGLNDDDNNVIRWAERQSVPERLVGGFFCVVTVILLFLIMTGFFLFLQKII